MRFDWPAILRVGMRETGLRPADFWELTPAEFWMVTGRGPAVSAMSRTRLNELMAAHPDRKGEVGHDGN